MKIAVAMFCALLAVAAPAAAEMREVADADVDRVIDELVRYLHGQQKITGMFTNPQIFVVPEPGPSCIATFALSEAGEDLSDPDMKLGLDYVAKQGFADGKQLYEVAFRTMVLSRVCQQVGAHERMFAHTGGGMAGPGTQPGEPNSILNLTLKKDLDWLCLGARGRSASTRTAVSEGAWTYTGPDRDGDNSCSQMALLALWEADIAGMEINDAIFRRIEQTWIKRQQADGGWAYGATLKGASSPPMTAAGLASLYICQDMGTVETGAYKNQKAVDNAAAYLAKTLDANYIKDGYLAFCVQRVGMTTGRKFLGNLDWFAAGAAQLCAPHPGGLSFGGSYGSVVDAAFQLIFLTRGRLPMTFNKLQQGDEKDWNYYNRDVPRFTEYMRRRYEQPMRWQVVDIADNVQLMLDAPILLLSSDVAPTLDDAQWQKLREYTLRGGTLLLIATTTNNNNNGRKFIDSVKKRLDEIYAPQRELCGGEFYKLEKLPATHPMYSAQEPITNGDAKMPLWGVSDGTRLLAILCEHDIAKAWQWRLWKSARDDLAMAVNVFYYVAGNAKITRGRMRPVFVGIGRTAKDRASVAWLKYTGDWNTQPYALNYLSEKLTAENRLALDVTAGVPITAAGLAGQQVAWMTGISKFRLSDSELDALRHWLSAGGVLVVNAVGGSRAFARSAEDMFKDLFPSGDFSPPDSSSGLITGKCADYRGPILSEEKLPRTKAWTKAMPEQKGLLVQVYNLNGRPAAIYCPWGIHDTLDGHVGYGAMSYMPDAALDIAENIALFAITNSRIAKEPASAPSSQPTSAPAKPK